MLYVCVLVKGTMYMYISGPGELPHVNNLSEKVFYRLVVILIFFSHSLLIARSGIDILITYYLKCYSCHSTKC